MAQVNSTLAPDEYGIPINPKVSIFQKQFTTHHTQQYLSACPRGMGGC